MEKKNLPSSLYPLPSATKNSLVRTLFAITGFLVLLHISTLFVGSHSWQWERLFRLDGESNVPTWFSSLLLAGAGLAAYQCQVLAEQKDKWVWILVTLGLFFVSCDEVAMIHETVGRIAGKLLLQKEDVLNHVDTTWPFFLSPVVALGMLWFLIFLPRALKGAPDALKLVGFGFVIYVLAAVVFEISEDFFVGDALQWVRRTNTIAEEALEMIGPIFVIWGLKVHQQFLMKRLEVRE